MYQAPWHCRIKSIYFILSSVSLGCGFIIYVLFRGSTILLWSVLEKPEFWDLYKIPMKEGGFFSALVNSGPSGMWLLSGILLLRGLWFSEKKTQTVYILIFCLIAIFFEVGQHFGLILGTFDINDLLMMVSIALLEGVVYKFITRRRQT